MNYKDIITYQLAEGVTIDHLKQVAQRIVTEWMSKQKGFIKWEINLNQDGSYTDIVYWESREDAKLAEKEMINIPNAVEWFNCYLDGSITSQNLTLIAEFS